MIGSWMIGRKKMLKFGEERAGLPRHAHDRSMLDVGFG
jgi:hypothetical protein